MIERTADRFGLKPKRLAADSAYGSASSLNWIVEEQGIAPHIPVFDRSLRRDGTFSRDDFRFDETADVYFCPAGKALTTTGVLVNDRATLLYRGSTFDCGPCEHKNRCYPNTPARKIPRSIYKRARDVDRALAGTPEFEQSKRQRKRVEMLFAQLKRILRLGRLRLRGPSGARDEFLLAATAQNLRSWQNSSQLSHLTSSGPEAMRMMPQLTLRSDDFFNEIRQYRTKHALAPHDTRTSRFLELPDDAAVIHLRSGLAPCATQRRTFRHSHWRQDRNRRNHRRDAIQERVPPMPAS